MQKKPNIRSIRYSDEVADLIERQAGENFSQKFEMLVTRAFYELPEKEKELARIDAEIQKKRKDLQTMSSKYMKLAAAARDIETRLKYLSQVIPNDL